MLGSCCVSGSYLTNTSIREWGKAFPRFPTLWTDPKIQDTKEAFPAEIWQALPGANGLKKRETGYTPSAGTLQCQQSAQFTALSTSLDPAIVLFVKSQMSN